MITAAIKFECPEGHNNGVILRAVEAVADVGMDVCEAVVQGDKRVMDLVVEFEPDEWPIGEDEAEEMITARMNLALDRALARMEDLGFSSILIMSGQTDFREETDYERQERLHLAMMDDWGDR